MQASEKNVFSPKSPPSPPLALPENGNDQAKAAKKQRKPGGWKAMPFVLGNETLERLASMGLTANFLIFLLTKFHMDIVSASNVLNIWSGTSNFGPLLGAFISDSYLGRFKTIAIASFAYLLGMLSLTLIAWIPQLRPPPCNVQSQQCVGATKSQLGVLFMALGFLSIGSSGIKPCNTPFGVDQFDASTEEGRKGINSFFNWYYATFTLALLVSMTVVIYIQESVSWVLGFGIPTMLMLCSIVLFFVGTRLYVYVKPEGSVFTSIAQVIVAAYKKRKVKLPNGDDVDGVYYDPPLEETVAKKLPFTNKFRFFNKAALISGGEIQADGSNSNPWRLCSIQKVEETKCLLKIIPIWAAGIIFFTAMGQQAGFTVLQAQKMERHLGKFKIPAGSLPVLAMITIVLWVPIYDRVIVPLIRKKTRIEGGITTLQRMGIGIVLSILAVIVAGLVEPMRRASALKHAGPDGVAPMSVFWLAPQLALLGLAEAFNMIAQIEFYNKEFPENMTSLANSLLSCTVAAASYLNAVLVNIVHNTTGRHGHPDWLSKDINTGRFEYFSFLVAGLGVLNLGYFLWVARSYQYKRKVKIDDDIEHNLVTT